MHTNIYIFGDSISFGCYDTAGGWGRRLSNFLTERYISGAGREIFTYNLSISGNQSNDILARFEEELNRRQSEGKSNIVIFAIGLNDSAFVHSKNGNWVDFDEFQENVRKLAVGAKEFSNKIFFVGLTPVDQEIVDPMPWDTDKSYCNEDIKKYDQALRESAEESGAGFIPIFEKFMSADYKKLLHDGAHPNMAGHRLIFEIAQHYLLGNKII